MAVFWSLDWNLDSHGYAATARASAMEFSKALQTSVRRLQCGASGFSAVVCYDDLGPPEQAWLKRFSPSQSTIL